MRNLIATRFERDRGVSFRPRTTASRTYAAEAQMHVRERLRSAWPLAAVRRMIRPAMKLHQVAAAAVAVALFQGAISARQSDRSDKSDRTMLLSLISAVDAAQGREAGDGDFAWESHALKSIDGTAFIPFRVRPPETVRASKDALMYVRAVSRHDGVLSKEERSFLRDSLLRSPAAPPRPQETVVIGPGEMPVGGPASSSSRPGTQAAAEASARLRLQERALERQREAEAAAKAKKETKERDPFRFPFEDYYSFAGAPPIERALALPAGEYDVFIAVAGRSAPNREPIVARRTLTVPDFWNEDLSLSSLILAGEVRTLGSPLSKKEQVVHPYTFGHAQVMVHAPAFTQDEVLSLVYQICNYGAPGSELTADYTFYRTDGGRQLFNRTPPQHLTDDDLPRQANVWETQAFTMQAVALKTFPPGEYEVEVTVHDRLTRATAKSSAAFTIKP